MEQLKNSWQKRKINHVPVESFYSSNQWILSLKWQKDVKTLMGFKSRVIMIIHDWNNGVVVNIRSILFAKKWRWISFYLALLKRILILNSKRFLLYVHKKSIVQTLKKIDKQAFLGILTFEFISNFIWYTVNFDFFHYL